MNVRSFRLSDYAVVKQLLADVFSQSCYNVTMDALGNQLSWDSEMVMVAEHRMSREVIGIIIGTIDNNNGYYYRIAVRADYRRQGVGKAMIESLKKRFLLREVNRIMVSVDVHNESIIPLYKSLGYTTNDFLPPNRLRIVAQ